MKIEERKLDRRIAKTKRAIKDEVLREMLLKKYHELTVTDICEAIDISRRTFYLHYYGIEAVFQEIFEDINEPLYRGFEEVKKQLPSGVDPLWRDSLMLKEIFKLINMTIESHLEYLRRIAIEPSYSGQLMTHVNLMKDMIKQYLNTTEMESGMRKIYLDYYIAGILELYFQWYRGAVDMTLDEIGEFANNIMKTDIGVL